MEPEKEALLAQLEDILLEQARLREREIRSHDQFVRMLGEAVRAGFDHEILGRVIDADCNENDVAQLAHACLMLRGPRRLRRNHQGDALVLWLLHLLLWRCLKLQRLPAQVVILFDDHFQTHRIGEPPTNRSPGSFRRAVLYYRQHPGASIAEIAKAAGVDRRTVRRWRTTGALDSGIFPSKRARPKTTD